MLRRISRGSQPTRQAGAGFCRLQVCETTKRGASVPGARTPALGRRQLSVPHLPLLWKGSE